MTTLTPSQKICLAALWNQLYQVQAKMEDDNYTPIGWKDLDDEDRETYLHNVEEYFNDEEDLTAMDMVWFVGEIIEGRIDGETWNLTEDQDDSEDDS